MHALLVEDSPTTRTFFQRLLEERGHTVTAVEDAETAWAACQHVAFPIIVLDWMLPGMDGLELCRRIRELPHGDQSVILLATARERPRDLTAALDAGASDYLPKSAGPEAMSVRLAVAERQAADLARRRQAELTLQRERDFIDAVLQTAGNLVVVLDAQGRIVRFNRACEHLSGLAMAEVLGREYWVLVLPPEELQYVSSQPARPRVDRFPFSFTRTWLTTAGEYRLISWASTVLLNADGAPEYYIGTGIDITERSRMEEALRQSESRFRSAVDNAANGIALVAPGSKLLQVNRAFCTMLGFTELELLAGTFESHTHPDDQASSLEQTQRLLSGEADSGAWEKRYLHGNGHIVWVEISASLLRDAQGEPLYFVSQLQDITARRQAEAALTAQMARLSAIIATQHEIATIGPNEGAVMEIIVERARELTKSTGAIIELVDGEDLVCRAANGSARDMVGRRFGRVPSLSSHCVRTGQILCCDDSELDPRVQRDICQRRGLRSMLAAPLIADGHPIGVLKVLHSSPQAFGEQEVATLQLLAGLLGAALHTCDAFAAKQQLLEQMEHQARHDALTGLPNRTLLGDRLQQALLTAIRDHTPVALLLMDLNRFKEVNDSLGHHCGDLLLSEVSCRVQQLLRASDTIARLGGDEFAVLLPGAMRSDAIRIARCIQATLDMPYLLEGRSINVGGSIGIALYPEHGLDATTLLQRADVAMYQAKSNGGGYALYAAEQDHHSVDRLSLGTELRQAIEQDQLRLHYQPLVDMRHRCLEHVEALVRWQHPQRGLIAPDQFIPLAEQTGLIDVLTLWVLETALRQCQAWQHSGLFLGVAVNLSARTLHDPQLPDAVSWLLRRYDITPARLTLEITESTLMVNPVRALEVLTRLAGTGVRIAIDDFGTGYSSLGYLIRLPVHEIKIDKSFVLNISSEEKHTAVVRSVIELGHNLGLTVVAEGVEDQAGWDILADLGCDLVQGYLISHPIPDAAVACRRCTIKRCLVGSSPSTTAVL